MPQSISVIEAIQLILAPAVMISACGLLMLGINSKFSTVLSRIRSLNEEKRKLRIRAGDKALTFEESQRIESIARQLARLLQRAVHVRNSLMCYIAAVALFIATSLLIGADFFIGEMRLDTVVIILFLAGMISVFLGIAYAALDTKMAYDIVRFDVQVDE
jgi:VIT1/CCC1 family predicted Fe2+/Mn2+ transporter